MSALVWDKVGDRLYEAGVSKGVLYQEDRSGVPWNGLISVEETQSDEVESIYFDGVKVDDIVTIGDFSATLKAFTFPDEFMSYEGVGEDQTGFFLYSQPKHRFHLCYRTSVGNDVAGQDHGYKIHIFYNLTAIPSSRSFQTMSDEVDAIEFEWTISSIPEEVDGHRPTSHVVFDSTKMEPALIRDIETILYGDAVNSPTLPPLKSISSFIRKWNRLVITDNGNGTWTAESIDPSILRMLDSTTFEITAPSAEMIDADSYHISSTEKNEEDLWQQ